MCSNKLQEKNIVSMNSPRRQTWLWKVEKVKCSCQQWDRDQPLLVNNMNLDGKSKDNANIIGEP